MSSLIRSLFGKKEERSIVTIDDYVGLVNQFIFNGLAYTTGAPVIQQTLTGDYTEEIPNSFDAFARLSKSHDVIFSCMAVRALVFSGIRVQWQKMSVDGQPSKLFGTPELGIFEHPWEGGTTQDLLVRLIQDVDLCGNSYWVREGNELIRLRPDWVQIILEPRTLSGITGPTNNVIGWTKVGYAYHHGGINEGREPVLLGLSDVAHFAPHPDPEATYRGMSWISPLISEIQNDKLMQRHKKKYLENGATASMVISMDKAVSYENFQKFKANMQKEHTGPNNAYKMMFLGAGADAKVVGADMQQLDFKKLQGHAETRIAAAAGVPPIIVGLSEGLSSATYSNYGQARRRFADATMHPLWQNVCGSLSVLVKTPPTRFGTTTKTETLPPRLWYDARDHPFLREDEKDLAEIRQMEASTIGRLIDAGFKPDTVIEAVIAQDWSQMEHTDLYSVQLQPPMPNGPEPGTPPAKPSTGDEEPAKKDGADGSDPSPDQAKKAQQPAQSGKSASNKE